MPAACAMCGAPLPVTCRFCGDVCRRQELRRLARSRVAVALCRGCGDPTRAAADALCPGCRVS